MIDIAALVEWVAIATPFLVFFGFVWAPKTWVPGELVTAASMNTNIRDNLNELLRSQVSTAVGTQNNFFIDGPFSYVKLNNATALEITGAGIDGGNINGARIFFEAIGAGTVTIKHLSSSSTSSNRFFNDTGSDIVLGANERAQLFYDTSILQWRVGKESTGAITATLGPVNLHPDPYVIMWPGGDTVAPAGATLTQDGNSAIARNTTLYKYSGMAPELKLGTTATASSVLLWSLFPSLPVSWRQKWIGVGAWVYSATAGLGKIGVADGGTGGTVYSAFHPGDSTWRWIKFAHLITSDATKLDVGGVADIAGQGVAEVSFLIDGITVTEGPVPPESTKPPVTVEGLAYFGKLGGDVAVATDVRDLDTRRPFIVTNVSLRAGTAPTGAALIVDANHWDGSAFQSMFGVTKPQIAAAASPPVGGKAPDGTYRYRCFDGRENTDALTDALMNLDVDQVGSTLTGADLQISVATLQVQDQLAAEKL